MKFIPRHRGNRLHVLFHICGKYHEKHDAMLRYLRCGTTACGGLRMTLLQDFHRDRQTRAASSRTIWQATERSVDAKILNVRRVGHQSHARDWHHQGCHHGHARGNGRSCMATRINLWFFRRRTWPRYWHHSQRTSEASSWCSALFTYDADCDLRDDNGVGAAI